jgi:hypothetical protein
MERRLFRSFAPAGAPEVRIGAVNLADDPDTFQIAESPSDGFTGERGQSRLEPAVYFVHRRPVAGMRELAEHFHPLAGQLEARLPADIAQPLHHVAR